VSDSISNPWPAPFESCGADPSAAAVRLSPLDSPEDLAMVEIVPVPRLAVPRPIGPGRRERAYLERVAALESDLARAETERADASLGEQRASRELELSSLVERGAERRLDRVEQDLVRERAELERRRQRENRLILALGALQNENRRLAHALERLKSPERAVLSERASDRSRASKTRRETGGWRALLRRALGR
jgi:hypothetical protein